MTNDYVINFKKRDEVRTNLVNILDTVMPNEIKNEYIKLIKLIDIYNFKIRSFNDECQINLTGFKSLFYLNDFLEASLNEINRVLDNMNNGRIGDLSQFDLKKICMFGNMLPLNCRKDFLENIIGQIKEITDIVHQIGDIYKKIKFKGIDKKLDNLCVSDDYRWKISQFEAFSSGDVLDTTIFCVIESYFVMWKNAFKKSFEIAEKIVEMTLQKSVVNVDEFNFLLVRYAADSCNNEAYVFLIDSILNHASMDEYVLNNDLSIMIAKAVSEVLVSGYIPEKYKDEFQSAYYSIERDSFMLLSCLNARYSLDIKCHRRVIS